MRIPFVVFLSGLAAFSVGATQAPASAQTPAVGSAFYVVRPDPRACPSPLCGGYWVSLANHARTRCSDGMLRPRCYVVTAETVKGDETQVPGNGLAKGALSIREFGNLGTLGVLVLTASWAPASTAPASGAFVRLRDTGIRCLRAPCFSIRTAHLNSTANGPLVSALDLGPARAGPARRRAEAALASADGLLAAGRIVSTDDGGRIFRTSQAYLKVLPPRA